MEGLVTKEVLAMQTEMKLWPLINGLAKGISPETASCGKHVYPYKR